MEIRHLQHFIALAEERQFTAAARKMNIVQSGLSVTIKELEQELGAQLVNRTTRTVSLTGVGELFLEHARSSLAMLNDGIRAVRSEDGVVRGRLHLGILQSIAPYVDLPLLLRTFRAEYPEVEFAVRSLSTETIPAQVKAGYVDLSFHALVTNEEWAGLKVIPFKQDPLVAVCSTKHPFATRRSVSLDVLAEETFVDLTPERGLRKVVDRAFLERNLKRDSVYQVSDVYLMLKFVAKGLGVAIVPSAFVRSWLCSEPLHPLRLTTSDGALPQWRLVIITRAQRRTLPGKTTVDRFLETLANIRTL